MWSLTSPRAGRISGPKKFCSSARKDFFNSICHKRTLTRFRKKEPAPTLRTDPTGNDPTCCGGLKLSAVAAPIAAARCILITGNLL